MKFLNLFKVLKFDFCSGIHEGSNSFIAWFQANLIEITVPPSQSPSVVFLLNSLKKTNFIKQNKILLDETFEFPFSTYRIGSYWNGAIPLATEMGNSIVFFKPCKLWLVEKFTILKSLFWMGLRLKLGDKRFLVYMLFTITWPRPYFNIHHLVCFICVLNCKFNKVMRHGRLTITRLGSYQSHANIYPQGLLSNLRTMLNPTTSI